MKIYLLIISFTSATFYVDNVMVAVGTFLIVAEMLKASGVEGAEQIRYLIQDIIHFGKLPQLNGRRALRKSVLSCCWKDEHRILIIIAQQ